MRTADLVQDQKATEDWAEAALAPLRAKGVFVSSWHHHDGQGGHQGNRVPGFGLVVVDEGSGEFHLMPDGTITRHAEDDAMAIIFDEHLPATDTETLKALFEEFCEHVIFRRHET